MSSELSHALGAGGALSDVIPGFSPRQGQIEMALAIEKTLTDKSILIAEAGTGTGKTFAYLMPVIMGGGKAIVSTGTKHLQDQLFTKDLPTLVKAMKVSLKAVLLKGRANYLCLYRLEQAFQDSREIAPGDFRLLHELDDWRRQTDTGDRVEFTRMPEDHRLWARVTSTADNCLGQDCPRYSDCFVAKVRKAAQEADLLVINHHLFCADMALKEDGFGELLPVVDTIVIDEAHQLPEVATRFFGQVLSSRRLLEMSKDVIVESHQEAADMVDLFEATDLLPGAVLGLRQALGAAEQKAAWLPKISKKKIAVAVEQLQQRLDDLVAQLDIASVRSQGLQACYRRALQQSHLLKELQAPQDDRIHWYETSQKGFVVHSTPLEISNTFRSHLERFDAAWVFTSATLAVGKDFSHFSKRLGLDDAYSARWDSPFDYAQNSLALIPEGLPEPSHPDYIPTITALAEMLIKDCRGGVFFLFTSYRALQAAYHLLEGKTTRRLLVQGKATRQSLIEQFRNEGDAILLATTSFWEGVDVRGTALSCVIIEKLPFAAPGEPVLEARLSAMRQSGGNPFMEYQLPQAVIMLKQGVGRLIRDASDQGLLVLCDPRLRSKAYGKKFLASLPEMPITDDKDIAGYFLRSLKEYQAG
ncbi:MAG: ATP-dependent DNA helicase [Thiothrix sp.]|nr:MAG: ATP-dependent DNA helicase [Thiothrix sp.]